MKPTDETTLSRAGVSLIVAFSENRAIGRDGDLPWRLSADLKRFKQLTMGHHLIMGRKTYESIDRLLPGRTTMIVTRNQDYRLEGATICHSIEEAIEIATAGGDEEPFVIGGAEIFEQALIYAKKLYLTRVLAEVDGDCFFPEFDMNQWNCISQEEVKADDKNDFSHSFEIYQRNE